MVCFYTDMMVVYSTTAPIWWYRMDSTPCQCGGQLLPRSLEVGVSIAGGSVVHCRVFVLLMRYMFLGEISYHEWAKRTKFLLAVIYVSPRRYSDSSKNLKKSLKKLKQRFMTIFGLAESLRTMNRPYPDQPDQFRQ